MNEKVQDFIQHISEKPWSSFTEADYTLEQWHRACLIHQHQGTPTSKNQCKLPVRTPNGVLNRNGVHSAAAALAGARTPINATSEEKSKAAKALIKFYGDLNEKPPASLMMHSNDLSFIEKVLQHHGVKGQRWGVRNKRTVKPASSDHRKISDLRKRPAHQLTNKQLKSINERKNLEQNFHRLNPNKVKKGLAVVGSILAVAKIGQESFNLVNSPAGKATIAAGKHALSTGKIGVNLRTA